MGYKKYLIQLLIFTTGLSIFQNCGSHHNASDLAAADNDTLDVMREKSMQLRRQYCASCHTEPGAQAEPKNILDEEFLIKNSWIIPGEPENSPLYHSLLANMPEGGPKFNQDQLDVMSKWIRYLLKDGESPAILSHTDAKPYSFGSVVTGQTIEHTFTLKNEGDRAAITMSGDGLNAPYSFKGGAYPGTDGTCLPVLLPQATCTIVVNFSPVAAGTFDDTIDISFHDGSSKQVFQIQVTGSASGQSLANIITTSSVPLNFGGLVVGNSKSLVLSIKNNGSAAATALNGRSISLPFEYESGGTCTNNLAPGASCTYKIKYSPGSTGNHSDVVKVDYHDGSMMKSISVALSGNGVSPSTTIYYSQIYAILSATNNCQNCHSSEWGSTYAELMAFKNGGSTPAIDPGNANSRFIKRLTGSTLGLQMGVGSRGNLSAANRQKIIDWIVAGAPDDPVSTNPAVLTLSAAPALNFGLVTTGSKLAKVISVKNTGKKNATSVKELNGALVAPFDFKGGNYPGTGGTCAAVINVGATCTIVVEFSPTSQIKSTGKVSLQYYDGKATKIVTRNLSGEGKGLPIAKVVVTSVNPVDFESVKVGSAKNFTVSLKNEGSVAAKTLGFSGLALPFKNISTTCSSTLNASKTCNYIVQFKPTASGTFTDILVIKFNDGSKAQQININLSAIGVNSAAKIYYSDIKAILDTSCSTCHNPGSPSWGNSYSALMNFKKVGMTSNAIIPSDLNSRFVKRISGDTLGAQMGTGVYGSLSAVNKQKILDWIAAGAPDDPKGTITQSFKPLIGDRYYVGSIFHKIFGTASRVTTFTFDVYTNAAVFGAPCFAQDQVGIGMRYKNIPFRDPCYAGNSDEIKLNADIIPSMSSVRESVRMTACMRVLDNIDNLPLAVKNAGLQMNSPINDANLTKAYGLFYPGSVPKANVLASLTTLGNKALKDSKMSIVPGKNRFYEAWRYIYLSLCLSPSWQAP